MTDIGNKMNAVVRIVCKTLNIGSEEEQEVNNPVTEEEYKQIQKFTSPYYEKPLTADQKNASTSSQLW